MSGQEYGYSDDQWGNESYQNGAGYEDGTGGETYQLQEQGYAGDGGMDPQSQPGVMAMGNSGSQADGSLFRSEEMALCQLFLQVMTHF